MGSENLMGEFQLFKTSKNLTKPTTYYKQRWRVLHISAEYHRLTNAAGPPNSGSVFPQCASGVFPRGDVDYAFYDFLQ